MPEEELPFVSVIVPARNEEDKVGRCLQSLAQQEYPHYEIVIIDDRSTDATGEIIAQLASQYPIIKPLRGAEAPPGWSGKTNALMQASRQAKGDWFLFTDADTWHSPDSVRLSVSFAKQKDAELISFMPVQELGSFWERVIMPVLLGSFLAGDPLNSINNQDDSRAYAYGQYILVRKDTYESVGGHASVRGQILEDIVFARVVKQAGHRVFCADGRPLYTVRMYSDFQSIWHGWCKNAYSLIGCNMFYLVLAILAINHTMLMPFVHAALLTIAPSIVPPELLFWARLCVSFEFLCTIVWFSASAIYYRGIRWYHIFLLPLGSLTVSAIYLRSAYLILTKAQVKWKGRTYNVNPNNAIDAPAAPPTTQKVPPFEHAEK
jgi:chlorobactene glucosyltransferase